MLTEAASIRHFAIESSRKRDLCEGRRIYLGHIREAIQDIQQYTVEDAVIRKFEIIGEAVKHVSAGRKPDARRFRGGALPACAIT